MGSAGPVYSVIDSGREHARAPRQINTHNGAARNSLPPNRCAQRSLPGGGTLGGVMAEPMVWRRSHSGLAIALSLLLNGCAVISFAFDTHLSGAELQVQPP
jgi:hypothetical protein